MTYYHFIFVAACLFITPAISAQQRKQNADDNLPDINELLDRASEQIATLQPDTTQAYLYRRLAALSAGAQDLDAAYNSLKKIRIAKSDYGQTAKNLRRVGFLEMVEEAAFYHGAQTAIKIIAECPDEYREFSDDAFGHIALKAAEQQDAKGAWMSIAKIKTTDGLYYYELSAAITLDDKIRGKKCLLEWHNELFISGECQIIGEAWYSVPWLLSLYQWCELNEEFDQLLDHACRLTSNPRKSTCGASGTTIGCSQGRYE